MNSIPVPGLYLRFHDDPGDGCLHDVGSVQAVDAVDAKHPALLADHPFVVHPEHNNTTQARVWRERERELELELENFIFQGL